MRLDVGGGTAPTSGHVNLDPVHGEGRWKRQAQDTPWLVGDAAVEAIRASHVMEHIPAGTDRVAVMNEAWRVLVPGGTFEIIVPLFPSWQAIADPTHVSYWVRESFDYFCRPIAQADYGIRWWTLTSLRVEQGWEAHVVLTKPGGDT